MGYEFNIIRRSNWEDFGEGSNITIEEWLTYGHSDAELKLNEKEGEGFFEWTAYPEPEPMMLPWFCYYNGRIYTKNPNYWVIEKLLVIAQALNAKVFGEEGEEYDKSFLDSLS